METRKIYGSYGVLAREKMPVFTFDAPASDAYDSWDVALPDGWSWGENKAGETLIIRPDGEAYLANQIVTNRKDQPCLSWYDEQMQARRVMLTLK